MPAEQPKSFLDHRAHSFLKLSVAYHRLADLTRKLELTALSGDVTALTRVEDIGLTGNPTYWPLSLDGRDNNVIELQRDGQMLVRLTVGSDGYYGCNRFGDGNHDWNIGELEQTIKNTLQRMKETEHASVGDGQSDSGQDVG
ncbi:MAG: hypothetical protein E6R03_13210 [Hyphomicrobiaceae bacterium]|nr:MAG: hypothetical protein E6R03_13210 [Hyphomicrobiaceae bacterium]